MEKIGILMLKTFFPRIIGDIGNLDTFEFPVKRVIVNNATSKNVVKTSDNNLIDDFIREAKQLETEGVKQLLLVVGFLQDSRMK